MSTQISNEKSGYKFKIGDLVIFVCDSKKAGHGNYFEDHEGKQFIITKTHSLGLNGKDVGEPAYTANIISDPADWQWFFESELSSVFESVTGDPRVEGEL